MDSLDSGERPAQRSNYCCPICKIQLELIHDDLVCPLCRVRWHHSVINTYDLGLRLMSPDDDFGLESA